MRGDYSLKEMVCDDACAEGSGDYSLEEVVVRAMVYEVKGEETTH